MSVFVTVALVIVFAVLIVYSAAGFFAYCLTKDDWLPAHELRKRKHEKAIEGEFEIVRED